MSESAATSGEAARGREATCPREMTNKGWRDIAWRVYEGVTYDNLNVVSAGVAFFALLSIFPAVALLVSIAGFFLDQQMVATHIRDLTQLMPPNAASIIQGQAEGVAQSSSSAVQFSFWVSLLITLFFASSAIRNLMDGMNVAYGEKERRMIVVKYLVALLLTFVLIVGILVAIIGLVIVPVVLKFVGLGGTVDLLLSLARWPLLAALMIGALALVYRFGPSRRQPRWRWITPGAILATVLWLLGSIGFSYYVSNFGSYNETYGSIGGVVILLLWFYLTAFVILLGAELNAEMEHQTSVDSTVGADRPMGERDAHKADTVAEVP
ncbi:MAG: YihY/virulence factor BrkB family protein [Paracoccaceae bacterium]